jgi:hypothetical protein
MMLACHSSPPAGAPAPSAAGGATSAAISGADLRTRLFAYADDSMQGREAGKLGNFRATTYIAGQVKMMGLEPAGDNGTYFQTLPLAGRTLDSATALKSGGTTLEVWKDYAPLPPIEGIPVATGGAVAANAVVFAGRMGDSVNVLSGDSATGKVVLLAPSLGQNGQPTFGLSMGSLKRYSGAAVIAIANWDVAPPPVAAYLKDNDVEVQNDHGGGDPHPVALFITQQAAERVMGASLAGLRPGTTGGPLNGQIRYGQTAPEAAARNVVAILRGSDPALRNEYVAIGAHNDHIGMADQPVDADSIWAYNHVMRPMGAEDEPAAPNADQAARIRAMLDSARKAHKAGRIDSVYNGADDDGSGTVSVLEIAQWFAAQSTRPKRSILFVWHTGEEKGLWGSDWYTRHPTVPRDSIVAQLNIDMVGRGDANDVKGGGPNYLQLIGSRRLSTELGDLVESTNTSGKHGFVFDYTYDANGHPENIYCRSDHAMYARFGIPIVFFTTGGHPDYHMLSDEPQYIDYAKMARVASLIQDIALHTANLDHRVVVDKPKPDPEAPCKQ